MNKKTISLPSFVQGFINDSLGPYSSASKPSFFILETKARLDLLRKYLKEYHGIVCDIKCDEKRLSNHNHMPSTMIKSDSSAQKTSFFLYSNHDIRYTIIMDRPVSDDQKNAVFELLKQIISWGAFSSVNKISDHSSVSTSLTQRGLRFEFIENPSTLSPKTLSLLCSWLKVLCASNKLDISNTYIREKYLNVHTPSTVTNSFDHFDDYDDTTSSTTLLPHSTQAHWTVFIWKDSQLCGFFSASLYENRILYFPGAVLSTALQGRGLLSFLGLTLNQLVQTQYVHESLPRTPNRIKHMLSWLNFNLCCCVGPNSWYAARYDTTSTPAASIRFNGAYHFPNPSIILNRYHTYLNSTWITDLKRANETDQDDFFNENRLLNFVFLLMPNHTSLPFSSLNELPSHKKQSVTLNLSLMYHYTQNSIFVTHKPKSRLLKQLFAAIKTITAETMPTDMKNVFSHFANHTDPSFDQTFSILPNAIAGLPPVSPPTAAWQEWIRGTLGNHPDNSAYNTGKNPLQYMMARSNPRLLWMAWKKYQFKSLTSCCSSPCESPVQLKQDKPLTHTMTD